MGLFRRRVEEVADPIEAFWAWWQGGGAGRVQQAIGNGGAYGGLTDEVSQRVQAIHPDLQWELGPGDHAEHSLCVTAGGVAQFRPLAERWMRAGPAADATWEYAPSRRADPNALESSLEFGPWKLRPCEMRFAIEIDEGRQVADVICFHPHFPEMSEEARGQVTFLVLDWLLGEDDVERWVRSIQATESLPAASLPADALPEVISALAGRHVEPQWALMERQSKQGRRVIVSARQPMRWIDTPLFDQHLTVSIRYAGQRDGGLPTPEALDHLRELEDDLVDELGGLADLVAHETSGGRRDLHLYADSQDPRAEATIRGWAADRPDVELTSTPDPGRTAMGPYR